MAVCKCHLIPSGISVVYMGSEDNHILDTYERLYERGGKYWWLYVSQCSECKKYLLIAQEERQNDLWCILELNKLQILDISEKNIWPTDFDKYETLLEIGYNFGRVFTHSNPLEGTLHRIIHDILDDNANVDLNRLSKLLNIDAGTMQKIYTDVANKDTTRYM